MEASRDLVRGKGREIGVSLIGVEEMMGIP